MAKFRDTIKATSERDATVQIMHLYPSAEDFDILGRFNERGEASANGRYFKFTVTVPDEEELAPEELGEEEY